MEPNTPLWLHSSSLRREFQQIELLEKTLAKVVDFVPLGPFSGPGASDPDLVHWSEEAPSVSEAKPGISSCFIDISMKNVVKPPLFLGFRCPRVAKPGISGVLLAFSSKML